MKDESSNKKPTQKTGKEKQKNTQKPKKNFTWAWPIKIFFITLVLSLMFSISAELILSGTGITVSLIVIVVLLAISVAFDMLGVAVAGANLEHFVAMSSKRVKGSKEAIKLVKSAEKVASFSSDVIGDMCGILSGAVGATIAIKIFSMSNDAKTVIIAAFISSIIAALTVFGKAMGKKLAITNPEKIVFFASKIINFFKFEKDTKTKLKPKN